MFIFIHKHLNKTEVLTACLVEGAHQRWVWSLLCVRCLRLDVKHNNQETQNSRSSFIKVLLTELSSVKTSPIFKAKFGFPFFFLNASAVCINWLVYTIITTTAVTGFFVCLFFKQSYCTIVHAGLKLIDSPAWLKPTVVPLASASQVWGFQAHAPVQLDCLFWSCKVIGDLLVRFSLL